MQQKKTEKGTWVEKEEEFEADEFERVESKLLMTFLKELSKSSTSGSQLKPHGGSSQRAHHIIRLENVERYKCTP